MAGLYLHIPFCKQACHYCDFHFSTQQDNRGALIDAMNSEIRLQKNYLEGETLETIYFGGGTPSLLTEKELNSLFCVINENFSVEKNAEITLEANPDDLTVSNLNGFKNIGVNRLSIGIQSFDEKILRFLNRSHSAFDANDCIVRAKEVGFNNISIDLIYAIPGQDEHQWQENLKKAVALSPEHISAYSLTIEEKTVFGNWQKKGKLKSEDDDVGADQMQMLVETLLSSGYEQYEISNFCRPGSHSRHNSSYWIQKKYLGIGPSAHSYNGTTRQYNVRNNALYVRSISEGKIPFEKELLSRANKINEYLLTTLRTKWGSNLNYLLQQFQFDLQKEKNQELEKFRSLGLIEKRLDTLFLTNKGKLLADKIASDLFTGD